jgi:hypothetical protein
MDKIVKRIEILLLKSFDIIYVCVKYMIGEWCGILIMKNKKTFVQTKIYIFITM